jgi:hypothetical protein
MAYFDRKNNFIRGGNTILKLKDYVAHDLTIVLVQSKIWQEECLEKEERCYLKHSIELW